MDLKEKIVSSYVAFEDGVNINSDIHEIRTEAFQNFEKLGFPSKKLESWKYTSLNSILKEDYSIFPNKEKSISLAEVKKYFIHDIIPVIGYFLSGGFWNEYKHLENSIFKFPTQDKFILELKNENFDVLETKKFMFGTVSLYILKAI